MVFENNKRKLTMSGNDLEIKKTYLKYFFLVKQIGS